MELPYDKIYSRPEHTYGGGKPEKVVHDIPALRPSGSVLELGAGEGRNALFLAEKGFKVRAVDLSSVGIEKINRAAEERGVEIQTAIQDIRTLDPDERYDVFVSTFVLHHLSREDALKLIGQMQASTNPDGLNAITVFTANGDFYCDDPTTPNFYPKPEELKGLYPDWEILKYEETESRALDKKPDGSHKMNVSANLLARKPK